MSRVPSALRSCALAIGIVLELGCSQTTTDGRVPPAGGSAGVAASAGGGGGAGPGASASEMAGAGSMAAGAGAGAAGVAGRGGSTGGASGASAMGAAGRAGGAPGGPPTFTRVWNEVLVAKGCAGEFCHGGAQGGLSLDNKLDAYVNLFEKPAAGPACGTSGKVRVKAGDPLQSLLLQKMAGPTAPCGELMPIGTKFEPNCIAMEASVCTTQRELQLVRDWITAGAKND